MKLGNGEKARRKNTQADGLFLVNNSVAVRFLLRFHNLSSDVGWQLHAGLSGEGGKGPTGSVAAQPKPVNTIVIESDVSNFM